jgi:hypothetical protein
MLVVAFIASEEAGLVTGSVMELDGKLMPDRTQC